MSSSTFRADPTQPPPKSMNRLSEARKKREQGNLLEQRSNAIPETKRAKSEFTDRRPSQKND